MALYSQFVFWTNLVRMVLPFLLILIQNNNNNKKIKLRSSTTVWDIWQAYIKLNHAFLKGSQMKE